AKRSDRTTFAGYGGKRLVTPTPYSGRPTKPDIQTVILASMNGMPFDCICSVNDMDHRQRNPRGGFGHSGSRPPCVRQRTE
ncbi:MAG: hypothetical protein ACXU7D_00440, partial [Burkholderiaceae bacterium]